MGVRGDIGFHRSILCFSRRMWHTASYQSTGPSLPAEHVSFKQLYMRASASRTLQASHALVVLDALRPWLPSDTRRRFQAGELLDNGAVFGAGRTGTSEVAEGLASFHRPYMTDSKERRGYVGVSRASGDGNTEGLRRHACSYEDQGAAPPPARRLRPCSSCIFTRSRMEAGTIGWPVC